MPAKTLFLIDATAFCYRAYYAVSGPNILRTSGGQETNAIYIFLNMLNKIFKEHEPDYLVCCFDVSRDTFRSAKFDQYKLQRAPMPDGLISQIPLIKEVIEAYGVPIFEKKGFEADDIIAHLARKAAAKKISVTIVSSDKDILQLVGRHIAVWDPYKDDGVLYDEAKVKERFGVTPKMVSDMIALMGDAADNIPGVPGVGEVTAKKLLNRFGSLQKILAHIPQIEPEKIREGIAQHLELIKLNRELVNLDQDLDLDLDLKQVKVGSPDYDRLRQLFVKLEFKKLLGELPSVDQPRASVNLKAGTKKQSADLLAQGGQIAVFGTGSDNLYYAVDDQVYAADPSDANLREVLASPKIKKTGYDLKKLTVALARQGLILEGLDFDLMIAAYLLNPARSSYSLEDLALENLGEFIRPGSLTAPEALGLVVKLKARLKQSLEAKELFGLFSDLEMPLVGILARMEQDGIKLDLDLLARLARELEQRLIKLIAKIYDASGTQFNINSPKQLGSVLFEKLRLPVVKRTKTGPSTDEEVLRQLALKHALPALLLEYRQLAKLKNTYVDALPKLVDPADGRVHTSFNQTGTETGRLSSSNPNLQNIPVKTPEGARIRQAIIAADRKYCLLGADYSQIELRVLAHLCHDPTLVEAFRQGQDVHRLTASLIYDLAESKVDDRMRETAKRVNFGIIYGQGAFSLSKDLGISVKQAQDFIDAYFLRYPKVKAYIDAQIEKAKNDGFVVTLMGRRRSIPEINNKNIGIRQFAQRQAVNTPIQGTASDLIKLAMIKLAGQIQARGLKSKMILQIHDELLFELPLEELGKLQDLVRNEMENVLKLDVPIKVDLKQGMNWLEMSPLDERRK